MGTAAGGIVGAIVGSLVGGAGAGKVAKDIADGIVEDDAEALIEVLREELCNLSLDYMVSEEELKQVMDVVRNTVDQKWLRRMYKETDGLGKTGCPFARQEFEQEFERIAKQRRKIAPPSAKRFRRAVRKLAWSVDRDLVEDWIKRLYFRALSALSRLRVLPRLQRGVSGAR